MLKLVFMFSAEIAFFLTESFLGSCGCYWGDLRGYNVDLWSLVLASWMLLGFSV